MSEPIRHHYLPECYLKAWGRPDGRLEVFHRVNSRLISAARMPKYAGSEDGLYSLEGVSDERIQVLEKEFFRPLDTHAADVLTKLRTDPQPRPSPPEKVIFAQFAASLGLRHPAGVLNALHLARNTIPEIVAGVQRDYQLLRTPDQPVTIDPLPVLSERNLGLDIIQKAITNPKLINRMARGHWLVFTRPILAKQRLLTCDRPLLVNSESIGSDPESRAAAFCVILSPDRAVVMTNHRPWLEQIRDIPPDEYVSILNIEAIKAAARYVYACDTADRDLIDEYLPQSEG